MKYSSLSNDRFSFQGRTNRWRQAVKQLEDVPLLAEQDDFFLKVWPTEPKEPPADSATPARITTADNIVADEPRVNRSEMIN